MHKNVTGKKPHAFREKTPLIPGDQVQHGSAGGFAPRHRIIVHCVPNAAHTSTQSPPFEAQAAPRCATTAREEREEREVHVHACSVVHAMDVPPPSLPCSGTLP